MVFTLALGIIQVNIEIFYGILLESAVYAYIDSIVGYPLETSQVPDLS